MKHVEVPDDQILDINSRGQIVIPAKVRKKLSLNKKDSKVAMSFSKEGFITLRPVLQIIIPYSFDLENDKTLRDKFFAARDRLSKGEYLSEEEISNFLDD